MRDATLVYVMDSLTPLHATLAVTHMLDGNDEVAEFWLAKIPRSDRGAVNKALEDLSVKLSRLGRRVDG